MKARTRRILLLMPTTTYRATPFLEAAQRLGIQVLVGSDRCRKLAELHPIDSLPLDLRNPGEAASTIVHAARQHPFDAIVPVDDAATVLAALAAERLGLPYNAVASIEAARNKRLFRQALRRARVPSPRFRVAGVDAVPADVARNVEFPCVLKPLHLSGSRGVIRADDSASFVVAFERIRCLLRRPDVAHGAGDAAQEILVEQFVPGREVALEGLLVQGSLRTLALFDKPDPLDGPYFEETIYVAPSRLSDEIQSRIERVAERAARALGLRQGPVHAELRVNDSGVWVIELAARSIGGRCSRILRFGVDATLEEILLRHTLGMPIGMLVREARAAGVMMIPIPGAGTLVATHGLERASLVPGIEDIEITIKPGERVVPLPEGASYLGFIFAKADAPETVEAALREAHRRLSFEIDPELPLVST